MQSTYFQAPRSPSVREMLSDALASEIAKIPQLAGMKEHFPNFKVAAVSDLSNLDPSKNYFCLEICPATPLDSYIRFAFETNTEARTDILPIHYLQSAIHKAVLTVRKESGARLIATVGFKTGHAMSMSLFYERHHL
jgi:hypothetical protein